MQAVILFDMCTNYNTILCMRETLGEFTVESLMRQVTYS